MLEECGLPYEMVPVNIGKGEQFAPAFSRSRPTTGCPPSSIPMGRAGRPISIFESGAILQYLGRKTANSTPRTSATRGRWRWLFWQMGGLGTHGRAGQPLPQLCRRGSAVRPERYTDEVHRLFGVMNKRLATRKYLAGDYSIADMACWGWVLSAIQIHSPRPIPAAGKADGATGRSASGRRAQKRWPRTGETSAAKGENFNLWRQGPVRPSSQLRCIRPPADASQTAAC